MRRLIARILNLAAFVLMGGGFGKIGVLLIGLAHPLSLSVQILIIGLGVVFWGWIGMTTPISAEPTRRGVHGSARLAEPKEVRRGLNADDGLIVGRDNSKKGALLRYGGPAHLVTIAPTRSGKGAGAVIPNLLLADRSALVIDPKGENTVVTARARERFGPVHVLDPFGITGRPSAAFNPLSDLDPQSLDLAEDVTVLADALVQDAPGQSGEAHWNEEAKALIAGVMLHVVCSESEGLRTLNKVRDLLTLPPSRFQALLDAMSDSDGAGGLVSRAANRQLARVIGKPRAFSLRRSATPTSWIAPAWRP